MMSELKDAEEFLGRKIGISGEHKLHTYITTARRWFDADPKTPEEMNLVYEEKEFGEHYLEDLVLYHQRDETRILLQRVMKAISKYLLEKKKDKIRVFDFGCGSADILLSLDKEIEKVGYDLNTVPFKFAKWRAKKHSIDIHLINKIPKNKFDMIICSDVLEHLPDPWKVIEYFKSIMIKDETLLFIAWAVHKHGYSAGLKPMEINYCPKYYWLKMVEAGFRFYEYKVSDPKCKKNEMLKGYFWRYEGKEVSK